MMQKGNKKKKRQRIDTLKTPTYKQRQTNNTTISNKQRANCIYVTEKPTKGLLNIKKLMKICISNGL